MSWRVDGSDGEDSHSVQELAIWGLKILWIDNDNYIYSDMTWMWYNSQENTLQLNLILFDSIVESLKFSHTGWILVFELEILHQQVYIIWIKSRL